MDEFSEKAWLVCKTVDIVDTNVNLHLSQQLTLVRGGEEKISSINCISIVGFNLEVLEPSMRDPHALFVGKF